MYRGPTIKEGWNCPVKASWAHANSRDVRTPFYLYKDVPEPDRTGFYKDFSDRNTSFGPDQIFVPNRTDSEWTGFYFGPDRNGFHLVGEKINLFWSSQRKNHLS